MEDLGLGESSLGSDLAAYLDGSSFVGASLEQALGTSLEQPFLGELDAIASRLEMSYGEDLEPDVKLEDLPSTSGAAGGLMSQDDDDDDDAPSTRSGGPKRRRRTRTERQQVLNRLAQQRYRQRKKEKVQALQSNVSELECQLQRVNLLEAENAGLRTTVQQLGAQCAAKDAGLSQAQQQLRQTAVVLKGTQDKCAAHERQLAEQQQVLEAQRQQLRASTLAGLDPQALSDRLLAIIKEAFADTAAQGMSGQTGTATGGAVTAPSAPGPASATVVLSEEVVVQISRTLTSCCRELVYASKAVGKQAAAEAPSAIPVSCC